LVAPVALPAGGGAVRRASRRRAGRRPGRRRPHAIGGRPSPALPRRHSFTAFAPAPADDGGRPAAVCQPAHAARSRPWTQGDPRPTESTGRTGSVRPLPAAAARRYPRPGGIGGRTGGEVGGRRVRSP